MAGNKFTDPLNISLVNGTRTIQSSLNQDDPLDFYQIRLNRRSNVAVRVDQLEEDANLTLFSSSREKLAESEEEDEDPEAIGRVLGPGTYIFRVARQEDNTDYRIQFRISPDPGDRFAGATQLGPRSGLGRRTVTRDLLQVEAGDIVDYYRFNVAARSQFTGRLDLLSGNADLFLFDGRRRRIGFSTRGGENPETISRPLEAGTYFVRVNLIRSQDTPFRLTLTLAPL